MELGKDTSKYILLAIIIALGILVFFLVKPILSSILWGLLLAYLFFPLYRKLNLYIKNRNVSAFIIVLFSILIILIPLWFVTPLLVQQVFELYKASQSLNIGGFVTSIFPTGSEQFVLQITTVLSGFISKLSSLILNLLTDFIINSINLLIHLLIVGFVFFYTLKDWDKLKALIKDFSPLGKAKEKLLETQFKDITNTLIYGQIFIGIMQGLTAGLSYFIFQIPNALILSVLTILFALLPMIGAWIIWVPAAIYLFIIGKTAAGIIFVLYNLIITSTVDNFLRAYLVSKKINLSSGIILIGMIGGLYLMGVLGLIIGPLILVYLISFVQSYKDESEFALVSKTSNEPLGNIPALIKNI
jgi:predicted PurR-regulated permease PerM